MPRLSAFKRTLFIQIDSEEIILSPIVDREYYVYDVVTDRAASLTGENMTCAHFSAAGEVTACDHAVVLAR